MDINPLEIIIHIINIVVLFVILRALLYKPIHKFMKDRTDGINAKLRDAEKAKAEAESSKQQYDEMLANSEAAAGEKAMEIIKRTTADAGGIIDNAHKKADSILSEAHSKAKHDRDEMLGELRSDIEDISVDLAGKILSREINNNDNKAIIDSFFEKKG